MKKSKQPKIVEETDQKYDEDGKSSDDEMPEVISNATMKSNYDILSKEIENLKQQLRQTEKAKRRKKHETCIAQKKVKMSKLVEDETTPGPTSSDSNDLEQSLQPNTAVLKKPTKKVYPSFNITVEPLTKVQDSRASAALDFKSRRLTKVPRESVQTAVISYQKKLRVRK